MRPPRHGEARAAEVAFARAADSEEGGNGVVATGGAEKVANRLTVTSPAEGANAPVARAQGGSPARNERTKNEVIKRGA